MKVTEVKIFPVTDDKLKAFVSVVLDHCFMVNDIKVIEGKDGRFISMPSRRKRNGKFKDIAHPLNSETRSMLEAEILGEYERALDGEPAPAAGAANEDGDEDAAGDGDERDGRRRPSRRRRSRRKGAEGSQDGDGATAPRQARSEPRRDGQPERAEESRLAADEAAQTRPAEPPPAEDQAEKPQPSADEKDRPTTLEEVTEKHLSDSFWTS